MPNYSCAATVVKAGPMVGRSHEGEKASLPATASKVLVFTSG